MVSAAFRRVISSTWFQYFFSQINPLSTIKQEQSNRQTFEDESHTAIAVSPRHFGCFFLPFSVGTAFVRFALLNVGQLLLLTISAAITTPTTDCYWLNGWCRSAEKPLLLLLLSFRTTKERERNEKPEWIPTSYCFISDSPPRTLKEALSGGNSDVIKLFLGLKAFRHGTLDYGCCNLGAYGTERLNTRDLSANAPEEEMAP